MSFMDSPNRKSAKHEIGGNTSDQSTDTQRKRAATVSSERPDWLPSGWIVQDRVRTSGVTAGTVDKYYYNPDSSRRFRSKLQVMSFLESGDIPSKRKKTPENSEPDVATPASQKQKSSTKGKKPAMKFDLHNVPEKIKWALADSAEGTWTPFDGEAKVPESTKEEWVAAFTSIAVKIARHIVP